MTDTPEAVRLEFERYFIESRKSKGANRKPTFERFEDGTYKDDHTQRHWWTWQNALLRRTPELEADVQEQARLNGMGAERELALRAQVSRLEAERDQLRAELEKVRVPDGWKPVPVEPTQEMLDAVVTTMDEAVHGKNADLVYREDWAAMLAAAPATATATALTDDDLFWLAAEHASSSGANSGSVSPYFIFEVNDLRNFIRATFTAQTPPHADQKGQ